MALNLRSVLCLFVAVLGLFAVDSVAADEKKDHKIVKPVCGKFEILKPIKHKPFYKCVPCGGYGGKKWEHKCHGFRPCRHGWKLKGKFCHKIRCGTIFKRCCKFHRCKHPRLVCKRGLCVPCGGKFKHCCPGHRCGKGLICKRRKCVPFKFCGFRGGHCCRHRFWWKRCRRGLVCWKGKCRKFHRRFKGKRGGAEAVDDDGDESGDDGDDTDGEDED